MVVPVIVQCLSHWLLGWRIKFVVGRACHLAGRKKAKHDTLIAQRVLLSSSSIFYTCKETAHVMSDIEISSHLCWLMVDPRMILMLSTRLAVISYDPIVSKTDVESSVLVDGRSQNNAYAEHQTGRDIIILQLSPKRAMERRKDGYCRFARRQQAKNLCISVSAIFSNRNI
ncbi:unnamed protein product [Pylaiella littoralis]